jgi:hypothetical protein
MGILLFRLACPPPSYFEIRKGDLEAEPDMMMLGAGYDMMASPTDCRHEVVCTDNLRFRGFPGIELIVLSSSQVGIQLSKQGIL